MPLSSEVIKGLQRHFRSPKEREEFARRKRKNDHILDKVEAKNDESHRNFDRQHQDKIAHGLEKEVHRLRKKGEIEGGSRKYVFSLSNSPV